MNSRDIFRSNFTPDALSQIVDLHLQPGVARGVDGVHYERFLEIRDTEIELISERAYSARYKFSPYKQKLILKGADDKPRSVSIPTLRDRVALRALNNFLSAVFPDCKPQHSHPVISEVLKAASQMHEDDCFIKLDIKAFYDSVNHKTLIRNLRKRIRTDEPLHMLMSALECPTGATVQQNSKNHLGIPQGLSISNLLASIYLNSIDQKFSSLLGVSYHRYVDDILCLAPKAEAVDLAGLVSLKLRREKKLQCHKLGSGKSQIVEGDKKVSYLGYLVSREGVSIRASTEKKFISNVMQIVYGAGPEDFERAIWRINLRITGCHLSGANIGWLFYFSQIDDVQLLAKLDAQIRKAATRRFGTARAGRIKRLVKAYHEVKYRYRNSSYFPNFDTYSRERMETYIDLLAPGRYREIETFSDAQVRRIFNSSVSREVRRMERDTLGGFS